MDPARQAALRVVGSRVSGCGYERPEIEGYSADEIDRAVDDLHRAGLLEAAYVDSGVGPYPAHWEPSTLTARARELLATLKTPAK